MYEEIRFPVSLWEEQGEGGAGGGRSRGREEQGEEQGEGGLKIMNITYIKIMSCELHITT